MARKKTLVEVTCANEKCGIKFMRVPYEVKEKNYCSYDCVYESRRGKPLSPEAVKKSSESHKGKPGYWTGKKMSAQHRKNLSDAHKPYWTPERRAAKSELTKKLWASGVYSKNPSRHSSHEYRLKPILDQLGYFSTIDTPKFITYDGRTREPDFFNPVTRDIIEIFGSYHHRDQQGKTHETPEEYIAWYAGVDYNCRVVWDYELDEFENEILDRINQEMFVL